jgi:uncharacterized protein (DUF697 family)
MSQPDLSPTDSPTEQRKSIADQLLQVILKAVGEADARAAAEHAAELRARHPDALPDELAQILIKERCFQTGAIGAITSGALLIPGLGTLTSLTFGVAADISMTYRIQAEMVLELAAAHQYELSPSEKRSAILLVSGISAGAGTVLRKAGREIADRASRRLVQKALTKALPVLGVAASAGTNIVSTYIIGRRAQAYFSLGPDAVGDWGESIRAITGLDERELIAWLAETTERTWRSAGEGARDLTDAIVVTGKSAGEVVIVHATRAGDAVTDMGRSVVGSAGAALSITGESIAAGTDTFREHVSKGFGLLKRDTTQQKRE